MRSHDVHGAEEHVARPCDRLRKGSSWGAGWCREKAAVGTFGDVPLLGWIDG